MLRPAAAALAFLTRLPVVPRDISSAELGRSVAWFPLAGVFLGTIAVAAATALPLDTTLRAIAVVALGAYLTGGLHLDGVADVADGLGGGRGDRARSLAIMRDSRIGAFGAIALVLLLLAKVHATALVIAAASPGAFAASSASAALAALTALWPLVLAPVLARALAAACIVAFPYARPDGLGRVFHDHARWYHAAVAFMLVGVVAIAIALASSPSRALPPTRVLVATPAAALAALALAAWIARRLGGLTGDAYGAAIETAELAVLLIATAWSR